MQASGHCVMSCRCRVQASGHCSKSSRVWTGHWPRDETLVWTSLLGFHLLGHHSHLSNVHWLTLPALTSGSPIPWKPSVEVIQVHDAGHHTSRTHQESATDTPSRLVNLNGSILQEVDLGQHQVRITDRDDAKGAIPWSRELPLCACLFVWHVYKHPIAHSHWHGSVGNFAVIVTLVTLLSLLDGLHCQLSGRCERGHQLLSLDLHTTHLGWGFRQGACLSWCPTIMAQQEKRRFFTSRIMWCVAVRPEDTWEVAIPLSPKTSCVFPDPQAKHHCLPSPV